ncbi:MAG: autotransporter domain-containing protein, partial [Planctomycetes bacterium]|nr:autotransporter domain-containing protein [Planctomycetota bacterium]
ITVSGLVIGKNTVDELTSGYVTYVIDGDGGITADKDSAFGTYVNNGSLIPTGKLEKWGDETTLRFSNLSDTTDNFNLFMGGIELHGGTVEFTDGRQLIVGDGKKIWFRGDSTKLSAQNPGSAEHDVLLFTDIEIVAEKVGKLDAAENVLFFYAGQLTGEGSLAKTGEGTLIILTKDGNIDGNVQVRAGTLQLGYTDDDGNGMTGKITANGGGFEIDLEAKLAYNQPAPSWVEGQKITGDGTVVQRGTGILSLENTSNSFTGGTEIERGTLLITNKDSYGKANNPDNRSGYITFMGDGASDALEKNIIIDAQVSHLTNSFRTEKGAGENNYVTLESTLTTISGVIGHPGGAFYVGEGTEMHVDSYTLRLRNNNHCVENQAGEDICQSNDLYVEDLGILNLTTGNETVFASGIDGTGTLNLNSSGPIAVVRLLNDGDGTDNTFNMGITNVYGSDERTIVLDLVRTDGASRVEFTNNTFNIIGNHDLANDPVDPYHGAMLRGDGIVMANIITVSGGTIMMPAAWNEDGILSNESPGTLTLKAPDISLRDFGLVYLVNGTQDPLPVPIPTDGIPTSNNSLLYLDGTTVKLDNSTGKKNTVFFEIAADGTFGWGDYLVIKSKEGFAESVTKEYLDDNLTAMLGGFEIRDSGEGPRGGYGFHLGGDPDPTGEMPPVGEKNIWFSHNLNSLSMDWIVADSPFSREWANGAAFFKSFQEEGNEHETHFLTGDKVYISGDGSFGIELPGNDDSNPMSGNIVVSGLVVGRNTAGDTFGSNGFYIISGEGGITADEASAFGKYAADGYQGEDKLERTGRLEKFGESTLMFTNTGGNVFREGIYLYGGEVEFTLADQLDDGGEGIHFKPADGSDVRRSTLLALKHETNVPDPAPDPDPKDPYQDMHKVTLNNDIFIGANFTGGLGAEEDVLLTYTGKLSGHANSTLEKIGGGVLVLDEVYEKPDFGGQVNVADGTLVVLADYGRTAGFTVEGGTLSGTGSIGARAGGIIEAGGTLRPGNPGVPTTTFTDLTVNGDLDFEAGSFLAIEVGYADNIHFNTMVIVIDEGTVSINPTANLNVKGLNYWNTPQDTRYTIIDAKDGDVGDDGAQFALNDIGFLPRGVELKQGWAGDYYQIWLAYNSAKGFNNIPSLTHNQTEIAKTVDWFTSNNDSSIQHLINRLSDPLWTDQEIRNQLDQLHGDLGPNAFFLTLKEPWRHPFNRLAVGSDFFSPFSPRHDGEYFQPRLWAEFIAQHGDIGDDGNAHGSRINRTGLALGLDYPLSQNSVIGANFQYTRPRLSQATGEVRAEDFEFGLYNMTRFRDTFDLKAYLGYSRQYYDFRRTVSLPETPSGEYGALYEQLSGRTKGEALAASLELTRPLQWRDGIRLLPVGALDFEKAWIRGFRESGGAQTSLVYDKASQERLRLRFGLDTEMVFNEHLYLRPRVQYAVLVNGQETPSMAVRFASGPPEQRAADIWGSRIGRNYLDLGLGAGFTLGEGEGRAFYLNYEAKLFDRATMQAGEAGFMVRW